jgi:DGQHR domain-containing protein
METEVLIDGIVSGSQLESVYRKRKHAFIFRTVPTGKEGLYLDNGWEIYRRNKKSVRLAKPKPIGEAFEDELWCLFSKIGFKVMNRDRNFRIEILKDNKSPGKQIDVFAKDDETVLVAECKTAETPKKRDLQKDMAEVVAIREDVRKIIYEHYGREIKLGWIFATKNIIWTDPDIERAENYNISIVREQDITYYSELAKHIGTSAKYQLLADIFRHKEIPGLNLAVPAIKGRMGVAHFYAFAIEPIKLLKIAYICHRLKGADEKTLITYQRMLEKNRLKDIRKYINGGGLFPNSLVLNLDSGKGGLRFDHITQKGKDGEGTQAVLGTLYLPAIYKSAFVIDGQHRLYGFTDTEYADKATIPVIAFENLDEITQANLFVDINSKQKRVRANLLEDLAADTKWGSDKATERLQALSSKIFSVMGNELSSPLYGKISASEMRQKYESPLMIASLTSALKKTHLLGHVRGRSNTIIPGSLYWADMDSSLKRAVKVISGYLKVFQEAMPEHWEIGSAPRGYLCTNGGITALFFVLREIIEHIDRKAIENSTIRAGDMKTEELTDEIKIYCQPLVEHFTSASSELLANYRKKVGHSGHLDCSYGMMEQINKQFPDFVNANLKKYLDEKNSESNEQAKIIVPKIQLAISDHVISTLKTEFGEGEDGWWSKGVPKTVRYKVVQRREDESDRPALEQSFDLIHYKLVILDNWKLFWEKYSRGKGKKSDQMSWMDELNRIRKKVAHPERGRVTISELKFLNEILTWLEGNN